MIALTPHFTLEEMTQSDYATRFGIDNEPPASLHENLLMLAEGLERVRTILGMPMRINSGYRSPKLNTGIGGAKNSAHTEGRAADFICPEFGTPLEICLHLVDAQNAKVVDFDQLIQEGNWVHIAFAMDPRNEILTAHFSPGGTIYSRGLT